MQESKQTTINVLHLYHQYKHLPLSGSVIVMMSLLCSMLQDWFANSTRTIAKAGHPVEWVTPLRMPVVQPYHKAVTKVVSLTVYLSLLFISFVSSPLLLQLLTQLQRVQRKSSSDMSHPPNVSKQKSAMPPSYVYSLGSTHMMLTSLYSKKSDTMINCMCSKF